MGEKPLFKSQNSFLRTLFYNEYYEKEKYCIYFGQLYIVDENGTIPLEVEFLEDEIYFWWWYRYGVDNNKFRDKMRNYLIGIIKGFFRDAYIVILEDDANRSKLQVRINFD